MPIYKRWLSQMQERGIRLIEQQKTGERIALLLKLRLKPVGMTLGQVIKSCQDYRTLTKTAQTFRGLIGTGALVRRGEGERLRETPVKNFHLAAQ